MFVALCNPGKVRSDLQHTPFNFGGSRANLLNLFWKKCRAKVLWFFGDPGRQRWVNTVNTKWIVQKLGVSGPKIQSTETFPSRTNDYTPWKINMESNNHRIVQRKFIWTKPPSLCIPAFSFPGFVQWLGRCDVLQVHDPPGDVSQRFDVRFTRGLWTQKNRKIQQVIYCRHYLYQFWTDDINQLALRPGLAPCSRSNFKSGSNMKCQPHWSRRIRLVEARKKLWMGQWGNIPNIPKESRRKSCLQSPSWRFAGAELEKNIQG